MRPRISIRGFVRPSVRRSVRPSVRNARVEKWKNERFRCFFGYVCWWGGAWGVDGGWMPLPTRPQRYCDPASLVLRQKEKKILFFPLLLFFLFFVFLSLIFFFLFPSSSSSFLFFSFFFLFFFFSFSSLEERGPLKARGPRHCLLCL